MYRMTYNHTGTTGCSARGIAKRESILELQKLAEELKDSICNIHIEKVKSDMDQHIPMNVFVNMKELR
ncbi:MAG: hypothetical protein CJD30_02365 [Sulfuricurvum sp. PD_MW2]|jgi:hypothetical protein|nr:MAG: hypothetical protein CJD30_02365 [Sulfuricurvum sp. PD_MW2]